MSPATANAGSTLADADGARLFPDLTPTGGALLGLPVAVVDAIPAGTVALLDAAGFALNAGSVAVDHSEASALRMRSDPASDAAMVSLFQANATAIRVVARFGSGRRRDSAVALVEGWAS